MTIREIFYERAVKKTETIKKDEDKNPTLFDFLRQICQKTGKFEYDKKVAPAFLLSLWLSQEDDLIDIVHKVLPLHFRLSDKQIYDYYMYMVPKKKRFIRYTKSNKKFLKEEQKILDLMELYKVSKKEALMINKHIERLNNG